MQQPHLDTVRLRSSILLFYYISAGISLYMISTSYSSCRHNTWKVISLPSQHPEKRRIIPSFDSHAHHPLTYTNSGVISHRSSLHYTSSTALYKHLWVRWKFIFGFNLKTTALSNPWKWSCAEKELWAKMKRIRDGLPVFWLVDGEYDSRRGGLLLDGGQEGKLTFTSEQLHHFLCDVCRGVNCSPNIWGDKVKWREIMSLCKLFTRAVRCLLPLHAHYCWLNHMVKHKVAAFTLAKHITIKFSLAACGWKHKKISANELHTNI